MALTWRGHTIYTESRDRRGEFGAHKPGAIKYWAACSCGFRSTWRATESDATGAALNHLWRATVSPEIVDKGRTTPRRGETMSKREFMAQLERDGARRAG